MPTTTIDYAKKLAVPPTLWYENRDGDRHVPTQAELADCLDPPKGFDFQRSQFPCMLEDSILQLYRDETGRVVRSEAVMTGHSGWSEDLVLAMTNSGKYKLSEAILVAATACERCMNALACAYGLDWGYAADSDNYRKSRTSCEHCTE